VAGWTAEEDFDICRLVVTADLTAEDLVSSTFIFCVMAFEDGGV
jgi:hypothetical protein